MERMRPRPIPLLLRGLLIVLAFGLAPVVSPRATFQVMMGDVVPLLLLGIACFLCGRNAFDSRGHTRLFWSLMTTGMVMWWFNQAGWTWFEVVLRKPLPDPFAGDIVLFLHIVPIMGAVAIRPHEADDREGMLISALNVFILLVWWVVVYAFFVFPEEYLAPDKVYTLRWDILYVVEGLMLIGISAFAYFASTGW